MAKRQIDFEAEATFFGLLASPQRLKILAALAQSERTPSELAELLGLPLTATSQHLSRLFAHGLVQKRRDEQRRYYSLSDATAARAAALGIAA